MVPFVLKDGYATEDAESWDHLRTLPTTPIYFSSQIFYFSSLEALCLFKIVYLPCLYLTIENVEYKSKNCFNVLVFEHWCSFLTSVD